MLKSVETVENFVETSQVCGKLPVEISLFLWKTC
jgi:hypothetical protein